MQGWHEVAGKTALMSDLHLLPWGVRGLEIPFLEEEVMNRQMSISKGWEETTSWDQGASAPKKCLLSKKENVVAGQENAFSSILETSAQLTKATATAPACAAAAVTRPPPHGSPHLHFSQISL